MMRAHLAYLWYVLRHKWFVFLACIELRVPLHQAIIHDWVKFLPVEWAPYVHQFFNSDGSRRSVRDASGAYDPNAQSVAFRRAWLHHQREPHHWQAWVSIGDGGSLSALPIPDRFIREMVADWHGAGRAINGKRDSVHWYLVNAEHLILHPDARRRIEQLLAIPYTSLVQQELR